MLRTIHGHHRFMLSFSRAVLRGLRRPIFVYLYFATGTLIALVSLAFWGIEHGSNPAMTEWFDALYFTVTTLTGVGFGDVVPVTRLGKVLAMLTMLGGTALFVAYTAVLASSILDIELRMNAREPRTRDDVLP